MKNSEIGGLDLAAYCKSYGYESNDADRCSQRISLAEACNWQHRAPGHRAVQESGPYSTSCVNPKGQPVGGIRDMNGYCHHRFPMSADVEVALANGTTWACQTTIDKSLACGWQYQKRDLAARQNGFLWTCYQ
ncbi:hypothetical protein [Actinomadura sp. CNU-125]|uniref:hypothetical protein n=1 Tax=Actinomadura sp. CNU-125 TaxID=1904961 RepID=UPI0011785F39|nr:hypothetical protein [Actinomadura sp. CNU-125]